MKHSSIVHLIFTFAILTGCASTPKPAMVAPQPTPAPAASVATLCVPGTVWSLDTPYLIMKFLGNPDAVFERIDYTCEENNEFSIVFQDFEKNSSTTEICRQIPASDIGVAPVMLYLHSDHHTHPRVYTRINFLEAVAQMMKENPCEGVSRVQTITF